MEKKSDRLAERRAFLKRVGVAAATAPAAALLLSGQAKAQDATPDPYSIPSDAAPGPDED
jgi:hypothetical protein